MAHGSNKTTELSEICQVCGGEVVAFARKPQMWKLTLETIPLAGEYPHRQIDKVVCINCSMDLVKYVSEVLAHKHDGITTTP